MQTRNIGRNKYTANVPKLIIFGDEQHIKEHGNNLSELNKLMSIIRLEKEEFARSVCKIVVEENEITGLNTAAVRLTTMVIYIAPEEYIDTYINGNIYEEQELLAKEIKTISKSYKISIDNKDEEFSVKEDGIWGKETTIFRIVEKDKIYIDARILSITFPSDIELADTESYLNNLFDNLKEI